MNLLFSLILSLGVLRGSFSHASCVNFSSVIENCESSVVLVKVKKKSYPSRNDFSQDEDNLDPFVSFGSGVIVDNNHILTSNHLIGDADSITIVLNNGNKYEAKVVGRDLRTDLAVVKISPVEKLLPVKWFSKTSDNLKKGDMVTVLGSPYGLLGSASHGIISYVSRNSKIFGNIKSCYGSVCEPIVASFIQFDAAAPQGCSGGGVFSSKSELIGVVTFMLLNPGSPGSAGVNFAIDASLAKKVAFDLINSGRVLRSFIGVSLKNLTSDLFKALKLDSLKISEFPFGALISDLSENGPAKKQGLKEQDILISINDKVVKKAQDAQNEISSLRVGESIKVKILRPGKENEIKELTLKTEELELKPLFEGLFSRVFGVSFMPEAVVNKEKQKEVKAIEGIKVSSVIASSDLQKKLLPGDIILKAQHINIKKEAELDNILNSALKAEEKYFILLIKRENAYFTYAINLKEGVNNYVRN